MTTNRFFFVSLALAALVAGRAAEPAKRACCTAAEASPAVAIGAADAATLSSRSLYQLEASWTNDAGVSIQLAALRGRPVVLAMFFAHCEYACPMLVADLQHIRASLPADVRTKTQFVLVSFDSARDTPAALKAYRQVRALDGEWTLLHGDANAVQDLAMLLGVKFKQDARGQFSHSNTITVLNAEGEIATQRNGLGGDISELTGAIVASADK